MTSSMFRAGRSATALFAFLLVTGAGASAHHGWSGYDAEKPLTVTGLLREVAYANPHVTVRMETEDGKVWTATLAPPSRMQRRGLPDGSLQVGGTVTVYGYPSRSDPAELRAERIIIGDTTTELR